MSRVRHMRRVLCLWAILSAGCTAEPPASSYDARIAAERQTEEAYRQSYIQSHPQLSESEKASILAKRIWIGMTAEQCEASLGKPYKVHRTGTAGGTAEQWVYANRINYRPYLYVYFEEGKLTGWQD